MKEIGRQWKSLYPPYKQIDHTTLFPFFQSLFLWYMGICLHVCLFIVCIGLRRQEEGVVSANTGIIIVGYHVSWELKPGPPERATSVEPSFQFPSTYTKLM